MIARNQEVVMGGTTVCMKGTPSNMEVRYILLLLYPCGRMIGLWMEHDGASSAEKHLSPKIIIQNRSY